jgi:hypothetical protein
LAINYILLFFFQLLGGKDCMEQQLDSSETLSSAGLALHYAHIIAKIDNAVCFRSLFMRKLVLCHLKTLNLVKCHFKILTPSNATLK